jgi:hypothetical protein
MAPNLYFGAWHESAGGDCGGRHWALGESRTVLVRDKVLQEASGNVGEGERQT